ncbi:hemagglutinin repeat-containing protein [Halomonas sp. TD01]|uniref:hemagglutinin repeat-containing protein n=1 Tax=Halomonas sp. TD01 TaxID=999141 RepID=UPI001F4784CC|nr:hemagglutinin repeat-containing protein [Halomonas sp. TD01]
MLIYLQIILLKVDFEVLRHSEEIGSVITGGGAINLTAGQAINLRAATVDAQSALALNAIGGDITLEAGQRTESLAEGHSSSGGGLFSSKTKVTRTHNASTQALASELGGQTVSLISGEDIRVSGANIVADQDLGMHAGGNLTLDAEQNTLSNSHFSRSKKSGLFSGGFGINLGSQRQMTDATNTATFVAPTTVGSIGGNVTLTAGDTYTQIGSDVLAPSGDILIGANTVNILEGRETSNSRTEQRFKQSGLSLSLSNPVMDSAQGIKGQIDAAGNTDSPRMQALAAANTALAVKDIQQQITNGNATDLSLNISLGSSQSRSNSEASSNTARGSTITAGGDLAIHALGQGDGQGNITVQGSQLDAGQQLQLNAVQDIHLLASADAVSQRDSHNSSSGSIGLGIGTNGIALNLDASRAKGHGNGDSTFFNNTQVSAGNQVILSSGGDTALKGAVVSAPQIATNIGGDLTIESLQDTAVHDERHSSSGFGASIPLTGGTPSLDLDLSRTKLNSDFQSVNEQSGLRAGDGGFQVNVGGTTNLTGGAITSTQTAIDEDRNRFTTAGQTASEALESGALTVSDIANNATYDAESISVSLSSGGNDSGESSTGLSGIGTGRDDGSASRTTESAISGLAGNQDARTGDADTGIAPIFDAESVRKDVQAQATITQEFGSRASKLVGDTAQAKLEEAQLKRLQADAAQAAGDTERANQLNAQADQLQSDWGDNGTKRLAAHTAIGALTGGTQGATGAAVGTLSAPAIASALKNAGLDDTLTDGLTALASTAAGAATGGTQGGAAAFNEVVNNYLRHDQVDAYIDELEGCVARGDCDEVQEKFRALSIAQQDELIALCATDAEACTANYQSLVEDGEQFRDALDGFSGRDIPWQLGLDAGPLLSQYMEAEAIVSQEGFAQYLQERHGLDVEQASVLSAVAAGALPLGSKRLQLNQPKNPSYQPVRNESTNIGGREYSGHALDRMQDRGILPSVVENTIRNGQSYPSRGGTTVFHSSENNISVVINRQGDVVTTRYGR